MLTVIAKLLKVLSSETAPGQIALAFSFAMVAGLTPLWSLHNLLVLFLILVLRANLSSFLVGLALFSAMAYLLDPLFHRIGLALLTAGPLRGLWTDLYNSTVWRVERFNNSIVMGSLAVSLLAFVPLYLMSKLAIVRYRAHALAWVRETRVMRALMASRLYAAYRAVSGWEAGP